MWSTRKIQSLGRREREKQERWTRILEAAGRLFRELSFEVGSGSGGNWLGHLINDHGLLAGLTLNPWRTPHAWRRGEESGTVYGGELTSWLDMEVDHVHA